MRLRTPLLVGATARVHGVVRVGVGLLLCASFVAAASAAPEPLCLRDGRSARPVLMFAEDGLYAFCGCAPPTITGIATVSRVDNVITLEHDGPDQLRATVDTGAKTGSATLQTPFRVGDCDIADADITDGGCGCDFSCILACPADMHVPSSPGKPGVRVPYPLPQRNDASACGAITCGPGSGTVFRKGKTVVRCAAPDKRVACTFSVTVD